MAIFRKFHHLYFLIPVVAYGLLYLVLSQTSRNINHDVTIFLEIGNRILNGQQPYVDFYEINFPMIQYLSIIPVFIARIINENVIVVTLFVVWLLISWSAISCYWLTRKITDDKHLPYIISLVIIVYSTALQIPFDAVSEFGQREHIFLLLFLPYVLIRIKQWDQEESKNFVWLRFLYGFIAGIGVTIKPFFLIAPIMLELYGLSHHKNFRKLVQAETIGFVTLGSLHLLYFLIFPEILSAFLDTMRLLSSYVQYIGHNDTNPIINLIVHEDIRNALLIFMVMGLVKFRSKKTSLLINVIRLNLIAGIIIFITQRGFNYHAILYQAMIWILMLYILATYFHPPLEDDTKSYDLVRNPIVYLSIIVLLYFFTIYLNINLPDHTKYQKLSEFQTFVVENTEKNESIFIINNDITAAYPELYQIDRWNSSPYLLDFPYSWGWDISLAPEKRINTDPYPIVQEWESRIGQSIGKNLPNIIVIKSEIDDYLQNVGFMDEYMMNYIKVEATDNLIAYKRID